MRYKLNYERFLDHKKELQVLGILTSEEPEDEVKIVNSDSELPDLYNFRVYRIYFKTNDGKVYRITFANHRPTSKDEIEKLPEWLKEGC